MSCEVDCVIQVPHLLQTFFIVFKILIDLFNNIYNIFWIKVLRPRNNFDDDVAVNRSRKVSRKGKVIEMTMTEVMWVAQAMN